MSISSTIHHGGRQLGAVVMQGGSGSFFYDPHTQTVQAVTAQGHSDGSSPFTEIEQVGPRTGAAETQDAEISSKEHSKTELQRLNQKTTQIRVHAIDDDECCDHSEKMIVNGHAKEPTSASAQLHTSERAGVGAAGSIAETSHQQPQVMRFCPSLSTGEIDISVSGKSYFKVLILLTYRLHRPRHPRRLIRTSKHGLVCRRALLGSDMPHQVHISV